MAFEIDATPMPYDPQAVDWDQPEWIARAHGGNPLVNAKRSVRLAFDALTYADFTTLAAKCNTAAHSIKVPAPGTGTYTTYATAYLHLVRFSFKDINAYDVDIVADYITA